MSQYHKAFLDEYKYGQKAGQRRHEGDEEREYLRNALQNLTKEAIEKPELNLIKGGKTLMPHEIVRTIYSTMYQEGVEESQVHIAQWKSAVENVRKCGSLDSTIIMSDVSGSMHGIPMEVSIALGLMISEVQQGPWKNRVLTFSESPKWFQVPEGNSLVEKVKALAGADWGGSTNIEAAFKLILDQAVEYQMPQESMPKQFIIVSDMCFNEATGNYGSNVDNATQFEKYRQMYAEKGYTLPVNIFWNVRSNDVNFQNASDDVGVVNLGGFSIALLKCILEGKELDLTSMTPCDMVLTTLNKDRYQPVFDIIEKVGETDLKGFTRWDFEDKSNYDGGY